MTATTSPVPTLSRPKLRQDVAFLETLDGVYVRDADRAFVLRGAQAYRWLSALVPHLDGETLLADLLDGLDEPQRRSVTSLVQTLASRGVVHDRPARTTELPVAIRAQHAEQVSFLEHFGDDGSGFVRWAAARVAVVGPAATAATLVEGLRDNGCGSLAPGGPERAVRLVDHDTDLTGTSAVLVVAARTDLSEVLAWAARAREAGAAFLPVLRIGDRVAIGPWEAPGAERGAGTESLLLRLADNRVPGAAELWATAVAGAGAAPATSRIPAVALRIAAATAAFESFKALSGVVPPDVADAVVLVDPVRLTTTVEPVVAHPATPAGRAPILREVGDGLLAPVAPDAPEPTPEEQAYVRYSAVVAASTGVFSGFDDDHLTQIPVKVARLLAPAAGTPVVTAYAVETVMHARLAALQQAAAAYALAVHRRCDLLDRPGPDARVVDAHELLSATGGHVDPADVAGRLAATGADGTVLAVPAAAVLASPDDAGAALFEPTLTGVVAAPDADEAVDRAVIDAAGAATVQDVAAGRTLLHAWDPATDTVDDAGRADRLRFLFTTLGADHRVDTAVAGEGALAPVVVARLRRGDATGSATVVARAGRTRAEAAEAALTLLAGRLHHPDGGATPGVPDLLVRDVTLPEPQATPAPAVLDPPTALAARGLTAVHVDLTPPDLAGATTVVRALLLRTPDAPVR
jgi:hypothetical protein